MGPFYGYVISIIWQTSNLHPAKLSKLKPLRIKKRQSKPPSHSPHPPATPSNSRKKKNVKVSLRIYTKHTQNMQKMVFKQDTNDMPQILPPQTLAMTWEAAIACNLSCSSEANHVTSDRMVLVKSPCWWNINPWWMIVWERIVKAMIYQPTISL